MPPKEYWNIRRTERREAQIGQLGQLTGLGRDFAAVVDFAVSLSIAQLQGDNEMQATIKDATGKYDGEVITGRNSGEIMRQLNSRLSIDGPRALDAESPSREANKRLVMHVELEEGQDRIYTSERL